jgi:hypothetical protein
VQYSVSNQDERLRRRANTMPGKSYSTRPCSTAHFCYYCPSRSCGFPNTSPSTGAGSSRFRTRRRGPGHDWSLHHPRLRRGHGARVRFEGLGESASPATVSSENRRMRIDLRPGNSGTVRLVTGRGGLNRWRKTVWLPERGRPLALDTRDLRLL